jgi:non-homologous end joining protein Ku
MAVRSSWSGAIEFAGFPINVSAYAVLQSASSDSFKGVCDCHQQPVKQDKFCSVDGSRVARANEQAGTNGLIGISKAVEVTKGQFAVLSEAAIESIESSQRTDVVRIERVCSLDSVPLHTATGCMRLIANDKVPGSDGPVAILWNGLRDGRAAVIEGFSPRSGAKPQLLVVYADDSGLLASTLPYADRVQSVPGAAPAIDDQQAAMFEKFVAVTYPTDDFDHGAYVNDYKQRRDDASATALAGGTVTAPQSAPAPMAAPDLMAAMQASLAAVKSKPKPKARPKTTVKA